MQAQAITDRIAGAPISWGICEVPGWGRQLSPSRVLGEMASLGINATELGAVGYLPTDPDALSDLLGEFGLRLVAGFVPVVLHDPDARALSLQHAEVAARTLAAAGADVFVSTVVMDEAWTPPVTLDRHHWRELLAGLDEVDRLAADHGLVQALHPHVGTLVERADDVQRVLDHSEVGWCLDGGHLYIGGFDPVDFVHQAGGQIRHVHLKDVEDRVARTLHEGTLSLLEATQQGLFVPLGEGDARVDMTIEELERAGYDGWYVIEQDAALEGDEPPIGSGPIVDVRRSVAHLRKLLAGLMATP